MAKELTKTLMVDGEEYNVNAVEADRVKNTLTIKSIGLTGNEKTTETINFNGESAETISVVSAETGGRFNKEIRVPNNTKDINAESVLNYHDTVNVVLKDLAKASVFYSWNEGFLSEQYFADGVKIITESIVKGISIIMGNNEDDAREFAEYNNTNFNAYIDAFNAGESIADIPLWFAAYLFICQSTDNIYFGSCGSANVSRIAENANNAQNADKLNTKKTILIDLGSTSAKKYTGEYDVEPGVKGTLPIEHGGTGANTAAKARENLIKNQDIAPGTVTINTLGNTSPDTYKHWLYDRYGIDLKNSDIIGMNALYFADASDTYSECINFVNTSNTNPEDATWDRLYARGGKLYFDPNRKRKDDYSATRHEVYHSGGVTIPVSKGGTGQTSLANVTVGNANKVKTNYYASTTAAVETKYSNITISPKAPSGGSNGDIWIKY